MIHILLFGIALLLIEIHQLNVLTSDGAIIPITQQIDGLLQDFARVEALLNKYKKYSTSDFYVILLKHNTNMSSF